MNYCVSLVFNDRIFHLPLLEGKKVEFSPSHKADIIIPNMGHVVTVIVENSTIHVSDTQEGGAEKIISMRLNSPRVLDETRRIALCVAEELHCENIARLGESFSLSLGRKQTGDGRRSNDIVFPDLRFASRTHFEIIRKNGKTTLRDLDSTNGTFVNGKRVSTVDLQNGDIISILTAKIIYETDFLRFENTVSEPYLSESLRWERQSGGSKELFKRSPRIQERIPEGKIDIPAPSPKANKPEINWLSTLLPAGVTIAIAVIMALAFQNTMMMLYSLPMTIAGVFVSIANYLRGNKTYQKNSEERRTAYLQTLDMVKSSIAEKREAQKRALLLANPSPEACLVALQNRSTSLWCREPDDWDFCSVRLGTGTVPFSVELNCPKEQLLEEDDLKKLPAEICRTNTVIKDMPILCDVRSNGVIGLLGTPELTHMQLQNMILHLATHHCYTELKIVCFFNETVREELSWLEDLPHTHGANPDERYLASTQEEADALFQQFTELFVQRRQDSKENNSYGSDPVFVPYVLFIFFEPKFLKKSDPVNQYLFMEQDLGVGCLMAAQKIAQLPKQCTTVVSLNENSGEIYSTSMASERQIFHPDLVSPATRKKFGQSMRPLYCDEGIAKNSLPKSYTLYQMLEIDRMSSFNIGKSWRASDLLASRLAPSAPIGVLENGKQIFFNSPPTGDNGGAHALVAGTTGSGKSEVLLTLILSLALRYPPEEVGFLVVDFKGDSIVGKIAGLPHLRGLITNLDGETLRRSLISIGAENRKRQGLFKTYNDEHPEDKKKISDIRDYTEKYLLGKVTEPMPHLFIIVDEFAEMKKQLPDIMDQFLSIAQTGRSLGVHLILATQSPSGVVDSKIRANIFKQLCLKVANTGESRDMIGSDLAAHIKEPGRAYLKTDDGMQLFQSAYGGSRIYLPNGDESTQLREAVDAIADYCRSRSISKLPDIFCPPLPTHAVYPQTLMTGAGTRPFGLVPIGIRDDPDKQFMGEYSLNVFTGNTLIVGSQMTGKTNLLQTILRGVTQLYGPDEINIYILDFASLFMKNYEELPQVGGVVTLQETEKITNLFRMLNEQIELRRQKFLSIGVSTFAAYWQSGRRDLPQILLIVDDLSAAKAYFPLDNDPLLSICKEGLSLGISVVASSTQPVGSGSYLPTFTKANRIVLYNNDVSVYATLVGRSTFQLKNIPGRGLVSWENTVYPCQSYLAFDLERELDCAEAIHAFCRMQKAKAGGKRAPLVPFIPKDLTIRDALAAYPEAYHNGSLMFGLDYETVKPLSIKLAALGLFAVSGRMNDVRNFQRYLITAAENAEGLQAKFYIIDGIDRSLQSLSDLSCVAAYGFLPEQAVRMILEVREIAEERYARVAGGDLTVLDASPTLVLMLNTADAINAVSSDKAALDAWKALTGTLKSMNVCLVYGALDNASIPFGSEPLKKVKDDRKLVFFDDIANLKIGDLPYSAVKKHSGTLQKGDGYLIIGNDTMRIRVPDCPSLTEK